MGGRRFVAVLAAGVVVAAACSGGPSEPVWSNSSEGATVSLGYLPDGFSFVGVEELVGMGADDAVAVSYVFENEDGSMRFSVAWQQPRFPRWNEGHGEHRDGLDVWLSDPDRFNRISWEEGCVGFLVESARVSGGPILDMDTVWRIGRSLTFDPDQPIECAEGQVRPDKQDWEFFAEVASVRFIGEFVVDEPWARTRLGPMELTLTDGQVLHVPEGGYRGAWCRPIDPDVWLREDDGCWIAGNLDEQGLVDQWETFKPRPRRQGGEVVGHGFQVGYIEELVAGDAVIRGYPIPVADDVDVDLRCCPDEFTGLEDFGDGWGGAYFDTDRGEIISVGCACTA